MKNTPTPDQLQHCGEAMAKSWSHSTPATKVEVSHIVIKILRVHCGSCGKEWEEDTVDKEGVLYCPRCGAKGKVTLFEEI